MSGKADAIDPKVLDRLTLGIYFKQFFENSSDVKNMAADGNNGADGSDELDFDMTVNDMTDEEVADTLKAIDDISKQKWIGLHDSNTARSAIDTLLHEVDDWLDARLEDSQASGEHQGER